MGHCWLILAYHRTISTELCASINTFLKVLMRTNDAREVLETERFYFLHYSLSAAQGGARSSGVFTVAC